MRYFDKTNAIGMSVCSALVVLALWQVGWFEPIMVHLTCKPAPMVLNGLAPPALVKL